MADQLQQTTTGTPGSMAPLVAGIIDGRTSTLESLENTVEVARHLADTVRPRNLYLSSNCELAFLPTVVAERKVQRLGEAARKVKQLVSV